MAWKKWMHPAGIWYAERREYGGAWLHAERTSIDVCGHPCREDALMTYCAYTGESGGTVSEFAPKALAPLSHPISGLKCMTRSSP